jgi:hypothetical protein
VQDLRKFFQATHKLSREEFLSQYPHLLLVVNPFGLTNTPDFLTCAPSDGPGTGNTTSIVFIKKQDSSNPFGMITVGRAGNNDIIIKSAQVSKFHAFFNKEGDGYLLVDSSSRNGTWLNGKKLEARHPYPVSSQDSVQFSDDVTCKVYSPEHFYDSNYGEY